MFAYPKILSASALQVSALTVQTKIDGVPTRKRISIYDRKNQVLQWHSYTDTNGEITRILPINYATADFLIVTALDDTGTYNAVVADNVQTTLLP